MGKLALRPLASAMRRVLHPLSTARHLYEMLVIQRSGSFDAQAYLSCNPDVAASKYRYFPLLHFVLQGWRDGRNPSLRFDTNRYLQLNPDLAQCDVNPLVHYLRFGEKEGRWTQRVYHGRLGNAGKLRPSDTDGATCRNRIDKLLFLHIPKAAGTSLMNGLRCIFGNHEIVYFHNRVHYEQFHALQYGELDKYKVVGGHLWISAFREKMDVSKYFVISLVREPVDTFLSRYFYLTNSKVPDHEQFVGMPVDEFIEHVLVKDGWDKNMMCRYISGHPSFDEAKKVLDAGEAFVAPVERLGDFVETLSLLLGRAMPITTANKNPKRGARFRFTGKQRNRIHDHIADDIRLYDYVKRTFDARDAEIRQKFSTG